MAGQPPQRAGLREALADLLSSDGGGPLPEDLADVLWISRLAGLEPLPTDTPAPRQAPIGRKNPADRMPPPPVLEDFRTDQPDDMLADGRPPDASPRLGQQPGEPHVGLYALTDDGPMEGTGPARLVQVTRPSALSEPLALARALRPLRQSVDSTGPSCLDEEATVQATGEARRLLPVWRPAKEPRFSVDLLVDTGATMAVWHRLAVELYTLLERHGAFADVRCWAMNTDTSVPRLAPFHRRPPFDMPAAAPARHWYRPIEDRTGRRLLLVLTDGVGPAWYATELPAFLTRTSADRPAAALQVLPRRLWHRTALHTAPVEASVADPTRPVPAFRSNAALPGIPKGARGARDRAAVRWLPVMEAKGSWLAPWAELTAGRSSGWTPVLAAPLQGVSRSRRPVRAQEWSAQEQVTRFRSGSSPDAYRLACYLAAAPLSLPVMRLVQRAMMPGSGQTDLAELFLSGLIERRVGPSPSGDPDDVVYDFRDGVRHELLAELTRGESLHILEQVVAKVSRRVAATFGGVLDFRALAVLTGVSGNATSGRRLPDQSLPFAEVAVAVLSGLGGQYQTLARQLAERAGGGAHGAGLAAEPAPRDSVKERRPHERVRRSVTTGTQPEDPPSALDGRLPDPVVAMAALPPADGRILLALYSPNGNVRYWDPLDRALVGGPVRLQSPGTVALASFSGPGGRPCLATVDGSGLTRVWDCADGSPVGHPFTIQSDEVLAMTAFPVDAGGPVLATSGYTGTVCLWDALDGRSRGRFTSTRTFLGRAMTAFPGPKGRGVLATADYTGRVRFWNLHGDRRHRLRGNITLDIRPPKVLAMTAFRSGPDGNLRLATIGYDDVVRLWDLEDTRARILEYAAGPAIPLRNLSLQAAVGWPEAVLTGCEAATAVRRELARTNPIAYEPELATSLHNLSIRYGAAGRTEDAIVAEEDATEIRRRLAETDRATHEPNLVRSLHNLSSRYALASREAEALAMRSEAVALHRRRTSRLEETDASSSEELARSILQLERHVAEMERMLGFDHPDTLASRNALAAAYSSAGDLVRAVFLLERHVAEMERMLGFDHPDTLASRNALAAAYSSA
ncbi:SAV_2336 N-terminal domain-related protein, partial [Streptomyces sp. NPDC059629]|uniref:SAV_2336 N-terminal domain-related protein n=1 Tax=Streptomyces sp. NPDC059629 TaxID=3346889 RepID=UPI0036B75CDC